MSIEVSPHLSPVEINEQIDAMEQHLPQAQSGEAIASIVDAVTSRVVPSSLEKAEEIVAHLGILNTKVQHAIDADPTLKEKIGDDYVDDLEQTTKAGIDNWRLSEAERSEWQKVLTTPRAMKLSPLMHSRMESLGSKDHGDTEAVKLLRFKQQGRDRLKLDAAIQAKYGEDDRTEAAPTTREAPTRRTTWQPKRTKETSPVDTDTTSSEQPKEVAAPLLEDGAETPEKAERQSKLRSLREKVSDLGYRALAATFTRIPETGDRSQDAERSKKRRAIGLAVGAVALATGFVAWKNGMMSAPSGHLAEQLLPNTPTSVAGKPPVLSELLHGSLSGSNVGKAADKVHEMHEMVKLHPGDTIWHESQEHLIAQGNHHPSLGQITEEMHRSMQLNGITEADAKHLPVGHKLKLW